MAGGLLPALGGHPLEVAFAFLGDTDNGIFSFHQPRKVISPLNQPMSHKTLGHGRVNLPGSYTQVLGDFLGLHRLLTRKKLKYL